MGWGAAEGDGVGYERLWGAQTAMGGRKLGWGRAGMGLA